MTAALVLIVLVSASETRAPVSDAVQHAAQEVLGENARVILQGYVTPPSDAELAAKAHSADLVAELTWNDRQHQRAFVRCYIARLQRFVNRELAFEDQDAPSERGRLIGFALASMAPEQAPPTGPSPAVEGLPARPRVAQVGERAEQAKALWAIDAALLGAVGLGGPAGGLGAGIAGRWFFQRGLVLRLATGVRHGDVGSANAASEFFFGGLGIGFQFSNPESPSPFTLGGRTDLLLISQALRRQSADDLAPERRSRLMGGADLLLEGSWYFWKHAGFLLNGGGELVFGDTDVIVQHKAVADIPALRLVTELGVRAEF